MTLTVEELISRLQSYPDDMPVITEGCDCYGDANSLGTLKDYDGPGKDVVLIQRGIPESEVKRMGKNEEEEREYLRKSREVEKEMDL